MLEQKVVVSQDVRALIQSIGPNRCNIFVIQNNSVGEEPENFFWNMFKGLLEPRYKSMRSLLIREILKRIPDTLSAAQFAGVSARTMRQWKKDAAEEDRRLLAISGGEGRN